MSRVERFAQIVVLSVILCCAFVGRHLPVRPDGLSYLDVARAYLRHDWSTALNGYWGPLYSVLIAVMLRLTHARGLDEFAAVRAVNFFITVFCVYAFSKFWRAIAHWGRHYGTGDTPLAEASPLGWVLLGYVLVLAKTAWLVDEVPPDIFVAGIVLLTMARLLSLDEFNHGSDTHGLFPYVRFGFLLVVGFYAKAILFYFGLFVLAALVIQGIRSRNYRGPIAAVLVCTVFVAPFVVSLTHARGHFTVGDSGWLNYTWFVDGTETRTWAGDSDSHAPLPFYPGRVTLDFPRVFQIPRLEGVTYAPWYDASRYDKRSRPTLQLHGQLRQIATNLKFLREVFLGTDAALTVCLIILICSEPRVFLRRFASVWFCTLPTLMVIGMYVLVHLVDRFMLGFVLALWGVAYSRVCVPANLQLLVRRALLAGTVVYAASTMPGVLHYLGSTRTESAKRDEIIAEAMPGYGVRPGDSVAVIGEGEGAYWAHWTGVSIVAELWTIDSAPFWTGSSDLQQAVLRSMRESGAKVVVWRRDAERACPPEWVSLPENSGCVSLLKPSP
jgi:hypothetical protein